jgi:SAM-dependent methyltransferase
MTSGYGVGGAGMDDASVYGARIADWYDDLYQEPLAFNTQSAVAFLRDLVGQGEKRILELGIGTGRVAIPLAEYGYTVEGIDASPDMVQRLHKKRPDLPVVIGDFAEVSVSGKYALIYAVFNTFFYIQTQKDQIRCLRNVAAHLESVGTLVIETIVPHGQTYQNGRSFSTFEINADRVVLFATRCDPATQNLWVQQIVAAESGLKMIPCKTRYTWPSELDVMAQLAGLRLAGRWSGWHREPFTGDSNRQVALYCLADEPAEG